MKISLYLNGFDIDSQYVYRILTSETIKDPILEAKVKSLISTAGSNSLFEFSRRTTVVVKTKKEFGYHFYWLSHKQNLRIKSQDCKSEHEFEIKADKGSGHCTLPPSTHRKDIHFRYSHVGQEDKIAILDELYDILTQLLTDCLIKKNNDNQGSIKFIIPSSFIPLLLIILKKFSSR